MKLNNLLRTGCLVAATLVLPVTTMAMETKSCDSGAPTPESYDWNFPREASSVLKTVEADALQVQNHADEIGTFATNPNLSWESHADQLTRIKQEVNDMGAKLCRLEVIRSAAEPWQQRAIDRTALFVRELANNTEQAIQYLNNNEEHLWSPTYRQYAANLFQESQRLSKTIRHSEQSANAQPSEKPLERTFNAHPGA